MTARAIRELIIHVMHGSLITGLSMAGCEDENERADAAAADGGKPMPRDGGAGKGGKGGTGGTGGGGVLPDNCFRSPVGVCCRTEECFPPEEMVGNGVSVDADGGGISCPKTLPTSSVCDSFGPLLDESDAGQCCYIRTHGTCCGRPFLDGENMLAAWPRGRGDWLEASWSEVAGLADAATRDALGRSWLQDARLEHASIASFAKLTLQMLALGAPAELIEAAQRASLDEIIHAQACFGLASRYVGHALGPSELPMPRQLLVPSLAEAAAAAVREGCIAETLAAVEASEQLRNAVDPQVQRALARIALDEAKHAALAYRFVRWALAQDDNTVSVAVRAAFADAQAQHADSMQPLAAAIDLDTWHAHGRLTDSEKQLCARGAWRDVIEPCARALFASALRELA